MADVPSGSWMPLVSVCAPAFVLPRVRSVNARQTSGDAIHEHLHDRTLYPIDDAMARLGRIAERHQMAERDAAIFFARCRGFEWMPPAGAVGELALALIESGDVVRATGGKGQYDLPEDGVTAATLDIMWSEPQPLDFTDPAHPRCPPGSVLWVGDYKTGDETHVDPVESNAQLATEAVLAAKFTGAQTVCPAVIFVRKGQGEWDVPERAWGPRDIAAAEERIRAWVARVRHAQAALVAGEPLELVEGPHCNHCPAKTRCPAHTGLFKQLVSGVSPFGDAPLSTEERVWLAEHLSMIEGFARKARSVLRADVEVNGAVTLSNGNVWGPVEEKRTEIVAHVALPVLQEELGALANDAVELSVSRDGIERAAKAYCEANKINRGVAPLVRKVMAKLGSAGALLESPRTEYRAHKPERAA